MKAIPSWKVKKTFKCSVILHKVTVSEIEDEFGQTEETETTYTIKAEIQSITLEDISYLPLGSVKEGDAWGFFLPVYSLEGQEIKIEPNDYITFKGIKYLIQRIEDYYEGNQIVYRRAYLKRQIGQ